MKIWKPRYELEPVLTHIQSSQLGFLGDPQADGQIDHLEHHRHRDDDEPEAGDNTKRLDTQGPKSAAVEKTVRGCTECRLPHQTDRERSPDATEAMDRDGADGIVKTQPVQQHDPVDHHETGYEADTDRSYRGDDGTRGSNADQTRQHPVEGQRKVRFTEFGPSQRHGRNGRSGRSKIGVDGNQRDLPGIIEAQGRARVEAKPAKPKNKHSESDQRQIVPPDHIRRAIGIELADARTDHQVPTNAADPPTPWTTVDPAKS